MVKCEECGKEFEKGEELKKHVEEEHPPSFFEEFVAFLQEYGVIGLAIAFIIGLAVKDLVSAIVDDLIMPLVEVVLPGGNWETATVTIGPATFKMGHLISSLIDFTIIALLLFAFVKYALKKKKVGKI